MVLFLFWCGVCSVAGAGAWAGAGPWLTDTASHSWLSGRVFRNHIELLGLTPEPAAVYLFFVAETSKGKMSVQGPFPLSFVTWSCCILVCLFHAVASDLIKDI